MVARKNTCHNISSQGISGKAKQKLRVPYELPLITRHIWKSSTKVQAYV
jgi:hypothetical protein